MLVCSTLPSASRCLAADFKGNAGFAQQGAAECLRSLAGMIWMGWRSLLIQGSWTSLPHSEAP